jgi:hypothetical protein
MYKLQRISDILLASLLVVVLLMSASAVAQPFPPGPDNDSSTSLGVFRIYIQPPFRPLIASIGLPPCDSSISPQGCYDGLDTFRLTSPVLYDRATIIARSNPHIDGSPPDVGGTPTGVGIHATVVGDGHHSVLPPFEGPPGVTEVHTAVAMMVMEDILSLGIMVRAGHTLGLPLCPGEVESNTPPVFTDLPGESFFDVFVEVTFPTPVGVAVLRNPVPLLVQNDSLDHLPPTVVYIHENSSAVPVRFDNSNPPHWNAGDLLGYMVLAGHGYSFDLGPGREPQEGLFEFLTIMNEHDSADGEMPLPPEACCVNRGNADGIVGVGGPIDVADLTYLVAYLFQSGPIPPCVAEGNIDSIVGVGGPIDVADLTYLVAFLFQSGAPPPVC